MSLKRDIGLAARLQAPEHLGEQFRPAVYAKMLINRFNVSMHGMRAVPQLSSHLFLGMSGQQLLQHADQPWGQR